MGYNIRLGSINPHLISGEYILALFSNSLPDSVFQGYTATASSPVVSGKPSMSTSPFNQIVNAADNDELFRPVVNSRVNKAEITP